MIFGTWNQRKEGPKAPKIHQGAPQWPGTRWWVVLTSYVGWISTSGAGKLISEKKSCQNLSAIGVTDLREYKKRFSARKQERETEENREGDPISLGLPPLRHHGGHGPEGELSSHLGGGQGRRTRREALSPSLSVALGR